MSDIPKVRSRSSVWIYGNAEVSGVIGNSYAALRASNADSIVLHCLSPRSIPHGALDDKRLTAVACPTASPFSHDANLMRSLAGERGILAVCGLEWPAGSPGVHAVVISPSRSLVEVDGVAIKVNTDLAGSDEALGYLLSGSQISYRPLYLYDDWLGLRISQGLQNGVGALIAGPQAGASVDAHGRVWLQNGPFPRAIAEWIVDNSDKYLSMLITLTDALRILAENQWSQDGILADPEFLAAFDVNCKVAPFVGFPLFSLTRRSAEADSGELENRVAEVSKLIPVADRRSGNLSAGTLPAVAEFLRSVRDGDGGRIVVDVTTAAVLLSDARRMVIDHLRRTYPRFKQHTRHRT